LARQIDGILFDLGDTLLEFGQVDVPSLFEAGAKLAYEYLRKLGKKLPPFPKYHRQQLWAVRWNYFKSRLTNREFNSLDLIGRLSKRMGHGLNHDHVLELAWLWYEPLSRSACVEPGLRTTLETLRDMGMKLGLISNTFIPGQVLDRHLAAAGLLDLLSVRIYSCDVVYRKPHRRIFELALKQANLSASKTIFVGDSPQADITGANRAGMISVLKSPKNPAGTGISTPAHRIDRISQLVEIVENYNAPADKSPRD